MEYKTNTQVKEEFDDSDFYTTDELEEVEIIDNSELSKMQDIERTFLNELYKYPLLSSEEQERLCWLKDIDKEAAETLFKHNLRLVVSVAKFYYNKGHNLDLMELIQEGCMGLLKGIENFDPSKGFKLTTYTIWWVKRYIQRAIQNTGYMIRLPINMIGKRVDVNKIRDKWKEEHGREPSIKELIEITGYTEDCVKNLISYSDNNSIISLDSSVPSDEKNEVTFVDILPDENFRIDEELEQKEVHSILSDMLCELDDKSRKVIELRVGFNGERMHTLDEIGRILGVTRERVRQIEKRALKKLTIKARLNKRLREYEKII